MGIPNIKKIRHVYGMKICSGKTDGRPKDLIEHQCLNYKTALEAGTEEIHKNNKIEIPITN